MIKLEVLIRKTVMFIITIKMMEIMVTRMIMMMTVVDSGRKIEDKADSAFHIFVVYWHLARNFFQKNDAWFYFTGIVFLTFFSNHQPIYSFTLEISAWHIVKEYQNVTHKLPESLLLFLRVPIRLVPGDYILLLNVLILDLQNWLYRHNFFDSNSRRNYDTAARHTTINGPTEW